jgi:hypothetical protein
LSNEAKDDILNRHDELIAETPGATRLKASVLLLIATLGWGISFPLLKASALLQQELVPDASSGSSPR